MNSYEPSTPRAAFGLAAVAMAAISIGAMVVLPAKLDSIGADAVTLASAKAGPTAVEVAISPAPIEVAISPATHRSDRRTRAQRRLGLVRPGAALQTGRLRASEQAARPWTPGKR